MGWGCAFSTFGLLALCDIIHLKLHAAKVGF